MLDSVGGGTGNAVSEHITEHSGPTSPRPSSPPSVGAVGGGGDLSDHFQDAHGDSGGDSDSGAPNLQAPPAPNLVPNLGHLPMAPRPPVVGNVAPRFQEQRPSGQRARSASSDGSNGGSAGWTGRLRDPTDPAAPKWWERTSATYMASQAKAKAKSVTGKPAMVATPFPPVPKNIKQALASEEAPMWRTAMDSEYASLMALNTWELGDLPDGVKPLPCMWLYSRKFDGLGNLERHKARLVVLGNQQQKGIDYNEVFAPTSKHTTMRTLLSLVASEDMELHQLDVKTAFLHGDLEEDIWMLQPPGYEQGGPRVACHLRKALYGLKQAPRAWHNRLKQELEKIGFTPSEADPGLYVMTMKLSNVFVLAYVDDILIAGKDKAMVEQVKTVLASVFDVHDKGPANIFVGLEITRDRDKRTLTISQRRMTMDLVTKYGLADAKPKATPLAAGTRLTSVEGEPLDTTVHHYSELIGSLLYVAVCTRPDISQPVGALSRYMSKPTVTHWNLARGVVRYLASTPNTGITYSASGGDLLGYCDADFAGDIDSRRSTTGFIFLLNGGPISWQSKLQVTVAASTTEAEYMAASAAAKEALYLRKLFQDFGYGSIAVPIHIDNQAALTLLKNPISSVRSKHIDVTHHFVRERVARKEIEFSYINTEKMVADIMTKALPERAFKACCSGMGLSVG